ncbi:uncharacterized protein LOC118481024 [Helianthus annuus]|uniref:uncharacterized protein LOC118481024 n=1 Tax=Helianthus annuus TaxID=4232 RepID=UPI0016532232|nr:uncharacterized protein LOC118481024 [Helianthus annuus]
MKDKIYRAWKEATQANRWDPDRECYLDPNGNIIVEPSSVTLETLIESLKQEDEQRERDAAKKAEEEELKSKKIDEGIIDTTKEMTAENLTKMADKVLMAKELEVDSKYASESTSKVSNSGSNNESVPKPIGKNKAGEEVYSDGTGVGYHQVPPPVLNNFTKKQSRLANEVETNEKSNVEKLPETIDATFTSSSNEDSVQSEVPKSETKTSNVQKPKVSDSEKQSSSTKLVKMYVPLDFYEKLEEQTSTSPKKKYVAKKDQPSGQSPKNEFFCIKRLRLRLKKELLRSISRWIMDSGASKHMTGRKTLLYDVRGFNGGYVDFAGFVIPEEWIIMRAPRVNDLYVLDMSVATTTTGQTHCFMSRATEKESELWHQKMGHIYLRNINHQVHNDLLYKGKKRKKSHPSKKMNFVSKPLERLHMDLVGPVNVKSITGDLYCLVVTDDYSRFSWVMFVNSKDETFESLLRLFRKIENLYRARIRRLRSDNGT